MLGPETDREGVRANGPVNPAPILRYTTDDLPPEDRYRTWYLRDWPRSEPIFRTVPTEPFNTRWESVQLGSVMFVYTEISGMRWERRRQDIRVSDFDPIIVNMMIEGEAQGDMDGRPFHETAGTFHFHDLSRPSLHASTASLTYSVVVPRPVAEQWFAPLQDLHGLVIGGAAARTLFACAEHVRQMLPRLDRARTALAATEPVEPISNIALRLGFGDATNLSRSFRKRYGMSPSDYRKLLVAGGPAADQPG